LLAGSDADVGDLQDHGCSS